MYGKCEASGELYCCGQNSYGELGVGDDIERHQLTSVSMCGWDDIRQIVSGGETLAILTNDGVVLTCGLNKSGQCGQGRLDERVMLPRPIQALRSQKVKFIAASNGCEHMIALTETGLAYSWGYNDRGQLGHENLTTKIHIPKLIESMKDKKLGFAAVSYHHSALVTDTGELYPFGMNDCGQLGLDHTQHQSTPQHVKSLEGHEVTMVVDTIYNIDAHGNSEGMFDKIIDASFTALSSARQEAELVPSGKHVRVTWDDKEAYARAVEKYRLDEFRKVFVHVARIPDARVRQGDRGRGPVTALDDLRGRLPGHGPARGVLLGRAGRVLGLAEVVVPALRVGAFAPADPRGRLHAGLQDLGATQGGRPCRHVPADRAHVLLLDRPARVLEPRRDEGEAALRDPALPVDRRGQHDGRAAGGPGAQLDGERNYECECHQCSASDGVSGGIERHCGHHHCGHHQCLRDLSFVFVCRFSL